MPEATVNERLDAILEYLNEHRGFVFNSATITEQSSLRTGVIVYECVDLLNFLRKEELIALSNGRDKDDKITYLYSILPKGSIFLNNGGYVKHNTDKVIIDNLNKEKLEIDVAHARKILKTYPTTQIIAIIACVISVCLLFLKIAEALSIWPYSK